MSAITRMWFWLNAPNRMQKRISEAECAAAGKQSEVYQAEIRLKDTLALARAEAENARPQIAKSLVWEKPHD